MPKLNTAKIMTRKEYKEEHIPHRINLLITYRERFLNLSNQKRQNVRDFERCAKDISMLMVRFFLNEFGVALGKGDNEISERKSFKFAKRLPIREVIKDPIYGNVLEVLKAANRAVAHIEENDVNHEFKTDIDDVRLFNAITYTENIIKTHIYNSEQEFKSIMEKDCNNMHRERLKL